MISVVVPRALRYLIARINVRRSLRRDRKRVERLRASHHAMVDDALRDKRYSELGLIDDLLDSDEVVELEERIREYESDELVQRGVKVGVSLSDIELNPSVDSHWISRHKSRTGRAFLCESSRIRLAAAVESAERERRKERRERIALIGSILAALTGIIGAITGLGAVSKR